MDIDAANQSSFHISTSKPIRHPPIIVDNKHTIREIQVLLPSSALRFKHMQIGTKILVDNKTDYDDVINMLKAKQFEYYSHRAKDQRQFKVFLYGLPKVSIESIKEDLKEISSMRVKQGLRIPYYFARYSN